MLVETFAVSCTCIKMYQVSMMDHLKNLDMLIMNDLHGGLLAQGLALVWSHAEGNLCTSRSIISLERVTVFILILVTVSKTMPYTQILHSGILWKCNPICFVHSCSTFHLVLSNHNRKMSFRCRPGRCGGFHARTCRCAGTAHRAPRGAPAKWEPWIEFCKWMQMKHCCFFWEINMLNNYQTTTHWKNQPTEESHDETLAAGRRWDEGGLDRMQCVCLKMLLTDQGTPETGESLQRRRKGSLEWVQHHWS